MDRTSMDRSERRPRENPAAATTGLDAPPETLRGSQGSARQPGPGDRASAKIRPEGRKAHESVESDALQESLEAGLEESFPGSDPVSSTRRS